MAEKIKFTAHSVARIGPAPAGSKYTYHWDLTFPGFGIRTSETGRKAWTLLCRVNKEAAQLRVGLYSHVAPTKPADVIISLADARKIASEKLRQIEQGIDPRKKTVKAVTVSAPTFEKVAEDYLDKYVEKGLGRAGKHKDKPFRTAKQTGQRMRAHPMKAWKGRPVDTITGADVISLLDDIAENNGRMLANKILTLVSSLFRWAVDRHILKASPITESIWRVATRAERERERYLTDAEIRLLWQALDEVGYPYGQLYKALLLTGQRVNEVACMAEHEIDWNAKIWTIPIARQGKSMAAHKVPLTPMMVDLLRSLPRRENNPLFFTNTQGGPAKSWSDANKKVLPAIAKLDCGDAFPPLDPENPKTTGPWIRHDLRRTLATNMQDMGIDTHMIDAIEGRLIQGTGRVYMRSDMIDEKRKALVKWEDRLRNILNPPPLDNIVPLNAAARN